MNDGGFMAVSPLDSNVVFCTGNVYTGSEWDIGVSHSSDGGTTWEHDTITAGSNGFAIAFDPFDSNRVYVGGDSAYNYGYPQFLITTDLGETWTASHTGMTGRIWTIAADPTHAGVLYSGTYQGVFKSTNSGASWAATGFTHDTRALVIDPTNGNTVYAGTYGSGVYITTDAGATWNPMNTGLNNNNILSLGLRSGADVTLFAGTDGGSVYRTALTTGIAGPSPIVHRSSFTVFPDPCRELATVSFSSSLLSPNSSLSIYDASGSLVRSFKVRTSSFELRTSGLAPGTYFVRLNAGKETRTARLTIVN